ncbi:MAG: DMT family transporter [Clostridia bacterium]|nr:DMT family transporter [Clostridia bacterium]
MPYFYLISSVFLIASGSILGSLYNRTNEGRNAVTFYNLIIAISSLTLWGIVSLFSFKFHAKTLWYSLGFAISYMLTNLSMILALKHGPLSLTSLFFQLSLIGATIWGLIFWNEEVNILVILGLIFSVVSIVFCLYQKRSSEEGRLNFKWVIFSTLLFFANVSCTVIQKTQIRTYGEEYGNMLMLFAMLFASVFSLIHFLVSSKKDIKIIIKQSISFPILAGICNGLLNLFVILMATRLPSSVVYPVVSIGGLCVSIFASVFFFKEKLKRTQWIGVAFGLISVLLLTL